MTVDSIIHILNDGFWFLTSRGLNTTLALMQAVNPHIPNWLLWWIAQGFLKFSDLVNLRFLLDPLMSVASFTAIQAVAMEYGDETEEDVKIFFRLGMHRYKSELGTGIVHDTVNCFFPTRLAGGSIVVPEDTAPMTRQANVEIAKSCALLSLLSYRHDNDIVDCMQKANPPMLPNTSFFSVHTMEDGDLCIYVADDQSWAVFCFRGTEPETLRDWCTSVLLNDPTPFYTGSSDPRHLERMQVVKVRDRYFHQMKVAVHNAKLTYHTGNFNPIPPSSSMTAFELALYLHRRANCKVYYTGHSLGGGLATLMGADLLAKTNIPADGIITFGSPPVGDEDFCGWFNERYNSHDVDAPSVSWRFVHGDEFAPMAPPLPFTVPGTAQQFQHVGGLIRVENLTVANPHERTYNEMVTCMNRLADNNNLVKIIMDHNLAVTLRALCNLEGQQDRENPQDSGTSQIPNQSHPGHDLENVMGDTITTESTSSWTSVIRLIAAIG